MSNKNLLNESTIRKFMKLASIEPLADNFVKSRLQEAEEELEEMNCGGSKRGKDLEEGYDMKDDELDEEVELDEMGMDMAYQDDEDMADMGADMGAEAGAGRMLDMDQFLQVLEKAVEEFLGEPTEVEYDAEAEMDMEEPEAEMDMEMDAEEPEGDMEMDMADAGEEMGDEEEEEEEEDLAEAIYKQVLKRLSK